MKKVLAIAMLYGTFIVVVFAQTQSTLRQKYGPPDSKGLYTVRPGIGLETAFYADGRPSAMTVKPLSESSAGASGNQKAGKQSAMNNDTALSILNELVPPRARGKQTDSFLHERSCISINQTEYEKVTVHVVHRCPQQGGGTYSVRIQWKKEKH